MYCNIREDQLTMDISKTRLPWRKFEVFCILIMYSHEVNDPMMKISFPPKCQFNLTSILLYIALMGKVEIMVDIR